MKMSKLGYFFEFLLFPPLVLVATLLAFRSSIAPRPATWAAVFCIGLGGWTLIEYFLHRVFFHHAPVLSQIHERHHRSPQELIGTPAWASVLVSLIAVAIPSWEALGFRSRDRSDGRPRHRLPMVRLRPLCDSPLAAAPRFLPLPRADAPRASPPFLRRLQFRRDNRRLGSRLWHRIRNAYAEAKQRNLTAHCRFENRRTPMRLTGRNRADVARESDLIRNSVQCLHSASATLRENIPAYATPAPAALPRSTRATRTRCGRGSPCRRHAPCR